jgi:RHS repeat-associated protein
MAFRDSGDYVVPCVVHWKVGHFAALIQKVGDLYELKDPTFGNSTWATKEALDAETSGYFLVPAGPLADGWRGVAEAEGSGVWGKGLSFGNDPQRIAKNDLATGGSCPAQGMATAKVHLMDVNLSLSDNPLGYAPPVGPPAKFVVRYNLRDIFQPANFTYGNLGPQWTSDWYTYVTDNPMNPLADVNLYVGGGGQRSYTGYDTNSQSYAYQQIDQNLLTRTGPDSYQLLNGDGSELIFGQSDGSTGSSRNIYLTQVIDPQGNALTFSYNSNLCLASVQDAIGQITRLTYGLAATNLGTLMNPTNLPADPYKLTGVTDPFGRAATFNYQPQVAEAIYTFVNGNPFSTNLVYTWGLGGDLDVIGIQSQFGYQPVVTSARTNGGVVSISYAYFVNSLTTPYGTTSFLSTNSGDTRSLDILYPDNSRERVEYNQTVASLPSSDPPASVPLGMATDNGGMTFRSSYYWDRKASALAYGDYSAARHYEWLHTETLAQSSGTLGTSKLPLEGRVWFDYAGQAGPFVVGSCPLPAHIGRVLDDGGTQLYSFQYNPFGHLTNSIDPVGRTLNFIYDTNGVDLLQVRQTRLGRNELLATITYNSLHRPLTTTDAAGQTTTFTYNAKGQLLTATDPLNETAIWSYDSNGYLLSVDGPLPGTNDVTTMTYDSFGRTRTITDVSGYIVTFNYDNLNRVTRVAHPDATFSQYAYSNLDCVSYQDRAGRLSFFAYDSLRQLRSMTDPLGRTTLFEWCRCGALQSITDPMGRTTSWTTDVQGRRTAKYYNDGSRQTYVYENMTSRLRQMTDERQQTTVYAYNSDDTLSSLGYGNASVVTPSVILKYDPDYRRIAAATDGVGTRNYSYIPISSPPVLGAGELARVTGPLPNETIDYAYDCLDRAVQTTVDGVPSSLTFDPAGRITGISNELGAFRYAYDGGSGRVVSETLPNGQMTTIGYGNNLQDFVFQWITNAIGATPISQFGYSHDVATGRISDWSQKVGSQAPSIYSFGYDAVNQLISATVTNSGRLAEAFGYGYDSAGNRLTELAGGVTAVSTYNALNQLNTIANAAINSRSDEWDAQNRLTAINEGNLRTEFAYDGLSRLASIRQLQNGSQLSFRRFIWCNGRISEERDMSGGSITKRYYPQGVVLETGTNAGAYFYARDHLGSVRELTDTSGTVRADYAYDPFGRRSKVSGDLDADFGFAGMFWSPEANLALTHFRAYDPNLGRWLSRDPLRHAEVKEGPNMYAYVRNEPIGRRDPSGLICNDTVECTCLRQPCTCAAAGLSAAGNTAAAAAPATAAVAVTVEEAGGPEAVEQDIVQAAEACQGGLQTAVAYVQQGANTLNSFANNLAPNLPNAIQRAEPVISEPVLMDTLLPDEAVSAENFEWAMTYLRYFRLNHPFDPTWSLEQWAQYNLENLQAIDVAIELSGGWGALP